MTQNKKVVEKYIEGFNKTDHGLILSCLTEDVEWLIPGFFHVKGKKAFDKEIENDAFVGSPKIVLTRMTEENNVVIAEGNVSSRKKDGSAFHAVFCDVFEMRDGRIKKLTSYLHEIKA